MKIVLIVIVALVVLAGLGLYYIPGSATAPGANYANGLAHARMAFQNQRWPSGSGTQVVAAFDTLVSELAAIGQAASVDEKLACFRRADATLMEIYQTKRPIALREIEQLEHAANLIAAVAGLALHIRAGRSPLTVTQK